ncbi:MAG: hypothetical protein AB8I08_39670 [Sandaracinaceae bacterium]
MIGFAAVGIAGVLVVASSERDPSRNSPPAAPERQWDGRSPLRCGGNERVTGSGLTATFESGPAIHAEGECEVRLRDVNVSGPTGIVAAGSAQVIVHTGVLQVRDVAADARDRASVRLSRLVVIGLDDGPSSPGVGLRLSGSARATLEGGSVGANRGIDASGSSQLRLHGTTLQAAEVGIAARGDSLLTLDGAEVRASGVGVRLEGNAHGSVIGMGVIEGAPVALDGQGLELNEFVELIDNSAGQF